MGQDEEANPVGMAGQSPYPGPLAPRLASPVSERRHTKSTTKSQTKRERKGGEAIVWFHGLIIECTISRRWPWEASQPVS